MSVLTVWRKGAYGKGTMKPGICKDEMAGDTFLCYLLQKSFSTGLAHSG